VFYSLTLRFKTRKLSKFAWYFSDGGAPPESWLHNVGKTGELWMLQYWSNTVTYIGPIFTTNIGKL